MLDVLLFQCHRFLYSSPLWCMYVCIGYLDYIGLPALSVCIHALALGGGMSIYWKGFLLGFILAALKGCLKSLTHVVVYWFIVCQGLNLHNIKLCVTCWLFSNWDELLDGLACLILGHTDYFIYWEQMRSNHSSWVINTDAWCCKFPAACSNRSSTLLPDEADVIFAA